MYIKPNTAHRLIAAISGLLPDVQDEIEQRKHSGNDEYWQGLDERYGAVVQAVQDARKGHGELSPLQQRLVSVHDEDGFESLASRSPAELADHDDGLIHFVLSEVSDCDGDDLESLDEAAKRLNRVADQVQRFRAEIVDLEVQRFREMEVDFEPAMGDGS